MIGSMVDSAMQMLRKWEEMVERGGKMGCEIRVDDEDLKDVSADVISRVCFGSSFFKGKEIISMINDLHVSLTLNTFTSSIHAKVCNMIWVWWLVKWCLGIFGNKKHGDVNTNELWNLRYGTRWRRGKLNVWKLTRRICCSCVAAMVTCGTSQPDKHLFDWQILFLFFLI